jgi:hypothetical protein
VQDNKHASHHRPKKGSLLELKLEGFGRLALLKTAVVGILHCHPYDLGQNQYMTYSLLAGTRNIIF